MLRRRTVAVLAAAALGLVAFTGPARADAAPAAPAPHPRPAAASVPGFAMGDPAPPPPLPAPLDSSGPAQVQALVQRYQTDAQSDQQKYNQLANEKGTLEQRAGDVQARENALAGQASALDSQANSLNSQAEALDNAITAHNNEPHTFQLPAQASQLAAYNEEKATLEAQQTNLRNQLSALTAQMDKLQSDQARAESDQTQLETDVQTHNDAVSALEGDVEKLAVERQQILAEISELLESEATSAEDSAPAPATAGDDEAQPAAAADPPAQAQALPSGGGDESAPADTEYTPVGTGSPSSPVADAPEPVVTQTPVRVTLAPSTVSGLPANQTENLNPSETFDGLIPEANGDYEAVEAEPPAGTAEPPAQKAFSDVIDNGGKATTTVGGRPATVDRVLPVRATPAENEGGDVPRPARAAPPQRAAPSWVPPVGQPNPGNGPPVSVDALKSMLDQRGLGPVADQFDLEYSPVVLDEEGNPAYAAEPMDAEGNPELGATGKPIIRFSNLGLRDPGDAMSAFDDAAQREELNGGSSPCPTHSFSGATRVLMADGSTRAIADIRAGDLVENARPGGGAEVHRVDRVHVTTTDTDFVDVVVNGAAPGRGGTVTGTANHPYYDTDAGAFVDAGALPAGDRLQSSTGTPAMVGGVHAHVGPLVTYDLTIDGLHTYYVVAGQTPVLVHNCGEADLMPGESEAALARDRAVELDNKRIAADPKSDRGTTAVFGIFNTSTRQWSTRVGFNSDYEVPQDWLEPGETAAKGERNAHAEENIVNSLKPDEVIAYGGTTRNICIDVCYRLLNSDGTVFGGQGWRGGRMDKTPYSLFWDKDWFD